MNEVAAAGFEPRIGVFTTDTELVVKSWDRARAMTGIPAADACGRHLDALVPDLSSRVPPEVFREPLLSGPHKCWRRRSAVPHPLRAD
jgi:hypothetical protein